MRFTGINKPKTRFSPRLQLWLAAAILAIAAAAISLYSRSAANISSSMVLNGKRITLELADTPEKRSKGLSGRSGLKTDEGMLFVFDSPGRQCMWMKDMSFNLDMVWLDEQKKITKIKKNASPQTYPESFCAEGRYVLELNAGTSDAAGLQTGQSVHF